MPRAFPIIYVRDVERTAEFYAQLVGFVEDVRNPPPGEGTPTYIGMQLDDARIGIVGTHWPERMLGTGLGSGPRYELFVFVDDVDAAFNRARAAGVEVRHEPETMPWGERIAYVADPEGNPVAFAAPNATRA